MGLYQPLLIALQFLTVLPVRLQDPPSAERTGQSLIFYPLIGLCIGAPLAALAWTLGEASPLLVASVLLAVWVGATGALHLDGLADSADAWIGGRGDRARTLAIMKDPYCGPAAVVTLVVVLLIKFAALAHLVGSENWLLIMLTPVLGRTALVLLFLTTPYVKPTGLGSALAAYMPRRASWLAMSAAVAVVLLVGGLAAGWMVLAGLGVFVMFRRLLLRRVGGTTGDTAGALVELSEAVTLLTAAVVN